MKLLKDQKDYIGNLLERIMMTDPSILEKV